MTTRINDIKDGYFWPTPEQELLLKASLLKGENAIKAWHEWAASVDFDTLDAGSQRLLPMLYKNLVKHNVQHPAINIYKGFYRMTWYKNRLIRNRINKVLGLLKTNNLPAILLKGAALVPLYYKDWALRPMNDFDLMVQQKNAIKTINILQKNGWTPVASIPDESDLLVRHACTLIDDSGVELDLHWHIMAESGYAENDYNFINSIKTIDLDGGNVSVLSHTDQLFHILVHGARWNIVAPLRWIPDSIMLMQETGSNINWQRLFHEARSRCLVMSLKKTLGYLHEVFNTPLPSDITSNLRKLNPSLTERMEFWMNGRPRSLIRDICYLWFRHVRTSRSKGNLKLMLKFPFFLRRFWKVSDDKSLAVFLVLRLITKIKNKKKSSLGFNQFA
ncbi:MAG: nucleotidyltransferase family protein [Nitrospiraceae bacterium]|nr:nucleotidyltransferase family protein [Nitrospiraceae bacterium]